VRAAGLALPASFITRLPLHTVRFPTPPRPLPTPDSSVPPPPHCPSPLASPQRRAPAATASPGRCATCPRRVCALRGPCGTPTRRRRRCCAALVCCCRYRWRCVAASTAATPAPLPRSCSRPAARVGCWTPAAPAARRAWWTCVACVTAAAGLWTPPAPAARWVGRPTLVRGVAWRVCARVCARVWWEAIAPHVLCFVASGLGLPLQGGGCF
jgi:hypothetical protein